MGPSRTIICLQYDFITKQVGHLFICQIIIIIILIHILIVIIIIIIIVIVVTNASGNDIYLINSNNNLIYMDPWTQFRYTKAQQPVRVTTVMISILVINL